MPKRRAEEPLEDVRMHDSPASKRTRVSDGGDSHSPDATDGTNGHLMHPRPVDEERLDILGAAEEEHQELVEAGVDLGIDEDESNVTEPASIRQAAPAAGYDDLYLDTIDRTVLDFDFEKLCSVTLSNINVYACLVCGKYFQGRGPKSLAYFHALDVGHHVYINLMTTKVYVLPEGYEVKSKSLDDIKFVADPHFTRDQVMRLDKEKHSSWDLSGKQYIAGFLGMNNIKANDYFNVVLQTLAHIPPLRNFFMLENLTHRPQLAQRFGLLIRKMWNPRAFKAHVSPHELLQEVALQSNKRFALTEQSDPVEFLSWFLNNLHFSLGGSRSKPGTSIVHKVFQGTVQIDSQLITARADAGDRLRFEDAAVQTNISRFLILTLDLPAAPLFQDELEKNIIPQVPLTTILGKYNGVHAQERANHRRRHRLVHPLPPFLVFHIKRFTENKFMWERNPTIVTFPVRGLDMSPYVAPNPSLHPIGEPIIYDLIANVTHEAVRVRDDSVEGEAERKVWKAQVRNRATDEWFECQDLWVDKVGAETLFTKESYIQVWEKRRIKAKGKGKP